MKHFKVELRGENFLLDLDGEHGKFGFTVTRIVKARCVDEAKRIAIIQVHHELHLNSTIVKDIPDAPRVYPVQVEQVSFFNFFGSKNRSFDFVHEENLQQ